MSLLPEYEKDAKTGVGLEPELVKFLDFVGGFVRANIEANPSVASLRAASSAARINWSNAGPPKPDLTIRDLSIGQAKMPARLYLAPKYSPAPTLIYLHGGGWMMLGLDTHDRLMRAYANQSGWNVLALDYPLAQEMQFPDNLNACTIAIQTILKNPDDFNTIAERVVLGGDSSGANMVLPIAVELGKKMLPPIAGLLLNYGVFDSDLERASYAKFVGTQYLLSRERMEFFWQNYCAELNQRVHPFAAPMLLSSEQLAKLPAVHMVIAAQDILVDENLLFAQRLQSAAVNLSQHVYDNAAHGFLEAVHCSPLADRAVANTAQWLKGLKV